MENEPEYQRVLSFLDQLRSMNASLNDSALMISYSETTKAIELHFEKCLMALALRKATLLSEAASKLELHRRITETQQKDINASIGGCTRILEGGAMLYNGNKDIAVAVWKNIATIEAPNLETALISVKLPEIILDVIGSHGTVSVDARRIARTKAGYVSTLPLDTQLSAPGSVHFNPLDGLYVFEKSSSLVKKISPQGTVTPVTNSFNFKSLGGMSIFHKDSIVYGSDTVNHTIKKRTVSGFFGSKVDVFAGNGSAGNKDGQGTSATFKSPGALSVDQLTGDVYVADVGNHSIRKITPQGMVSTVAGSGMAGFTDGIGSAAMFNLSENTALWLNENTQTLFVCDGNKIRLIATTNGEVSTLPCNISGPQGVLVLADGTILVSSATDNGVYQIKKHAKDKYELIPIVGSGEPGDVDGPPALCKLRTPCGLAFDESTNTCFVADYGNRSIRKFTYV